MCGGSGAGGGSGGGESLAYDIELVGSERTKREVPIL